MDLLLGLDVGTTATKASLFELSGQTVASASHPNPLLTPRQGWVEQDPEALWRGVVAVTRALSAQVRPGDRIVALSQSSQAGTTIPVDDQGRPTHNAFSWMDGRAAAECEQVRRSYGADAIYRTTGWVLWAGLPLQHIAWFRNHCPARFELTRRFLFVNDFIGQRLTGALCMNPSDASITQLFNVATGDWDDALLALAGIRRDQLSAVRPSGYLVGGLTAAAGAETGLPEGLPVVNGAHDQYCAAVGLGITRPGPVMLSCGTAWVILAVPETLEAGFRGDMRISRHAVEGRWGAILSLGGVGRSLEWLVDNVWGSGEATAARPVLYEAVNQAAARAPAGAAGLLCFPLAGGHAETVGAGGGGFVGLTLAHGRDEMARAVMEGVACELRRSLEAIQAAGVRVNELTMVGGAARSPIWPQIVADVTGIPVVLPGITEAASWGAAVLAGVGVGLFPSAETAAVSDFGSLAPGRRCNPIPEHGPVYAEVYERYRRFCRLLFE